MKEFFLNTVFFIFVFVLLILVFALLGGVLRDNEYKSPAVKITAPCELPIEWGAHYIAINDSTFVIYSPTDTVTCSTQK